ncbi:HAD family hydrolase [Pseudofrankia asymbiotica]|uniref:HAD family hydrolase n=1 Tax=Pseudofrankia asymbiotica TaxID=1834516 RepID=A0A1V2IAR3_9ACTN|nr:HAD family hydrolase [Pseudofrankia asymbiotica]
MGDSVAVLLDIDGTLVDTNYFHALAWYRAFRQEGHPVTVTDLHRRIGMGSDQMLDAVLPDRDRGRDDVLQAAHTEHYAAFFGLIRPLPGARDLLRHLRRSGAQVVLATSAPPEELRVLRRSLAAEDALTAVTSSADAENAKPEPDILAAALDAAGVGAEEAVMVGDSRWDVLAASKAGLACVGVLTGGISRAELDDAGAVAVYRDPADLLDHLDDSPVGRLLRRIP